MRVVVLAVACTASLGFAQSAKYVTFPSGHDSTAGGSYTYILGSYRNAHYQMGDGTNKGPARIYSGVDYRPDPGRFYSTASGMGRSFTRVTLDMSETDLDAMTATFARNRATSMTRVYDSRTIWPTLSGRITSTGWTGSKFPFSKLWAHGGKRDVCFDFDFAGGALQNKAAWASNKIYPYFMDGVFTETASVGTASYQPRTLGTCNDSAHTHTSGAFCYAAAIWYGDKFVPSHFVDSLLIYHYTNHTAPNATVLQALCLNGSDTGVDIGATCNKLHVDLNSLIQFTQRTANSTGYSSYTTLQGYFLLPYYKPWGGATLRVQGAWTDSKTNALSLTVSRKFQIPTRKPVALRKRCAVGWSGLEGRANYVTGYFIYQTLARMTYR